MNILDYIVLAIYFSGLIAVGVLVSKKIKNSADMFIASGRSSWWLSGLSTYMTIFSASTFVIWGGVAFKSGMVAVLIANLVGVACFFAGKWFAPRWRNIKLNSPGEFVKIRFGNVTLDFYSITGMIGKGVHASVALYAVSIVMSTLIPLSPDNPLANPSGHLAVGWAVLILGSITLIYTAIGGFLAVLMTDMIQFGVLMTVAIFLVPLSLHSIGGVGNFISSAPAGFFVPVSHDYPWFWLILWLGLNTFQMGGDWPYVQRYLSVPSAKDAKKSNYLVAVLYLLTPLIWYLPAMAYHIVDPNANPEQAYVLMSQRVLMNGMLGVMLAAMVSATLSCVSGTLNVFANVFTNDIYCRKHPDVDEKKKISVGRRFTLIYGICITAIALVIPFAGGAERVVVTLLTMVIAPLYIPSVWALFSKRIRGKDAMIVLAITYAIGITGKFTVAEYINPQVFEATCGFAIPVVLLSLFELYHKAKNYRCSGYDEIQKITAPTDIVMTKELKTGVKNYSILAVKCFVLTLAGIALLLSGVVLFSKDEAKLQDAYTLKTTIIAIAIMAVLIAAFYIYRMIDCRNEARAKVRS